MRGEYFSWLSHDDVYYPSKIEVQVNYLEKFENKLTVLYSDQDYINNDGVIIGEHVCPQIETRSFKLDFIRGWILHFCTTLVPRECFRQSGVFNIELITSQDLEMIYRLSLKYNFVHIPKKLVKVRLHDMMGQVSLKETVIAENDKLRLSFLKAVSFHEIQKYSSEPPGGYFLRFAEIMKEANYKHATKYAAKLAIKGLINNYKNDNKAMLFKALTILYPDLMGKYKKVRIKIKFVKSIL